MEGVQWAVREEYVGEAYEYYPLRQHVVMAQGVCGGQPTLKYCRIEARFILERLAAGLTVQELVEEYEESALSAEAIEEALHRAVGGCVSKTDLNESHDESCHVPSWPRCVSRRGFRLASLAPAVPCPQSMAGFAPDALFTVTTPLGFAVRTSAAYWQRLITKHPDLAGREADISTVLGAPQQVRRSRHDAAVLLFYAPDATAPHLWLAAVVRRLNGGGFVVTAYRTDSIKEGERVWPR